MRYVSEVLLLAACGYLVGSMPFGYWLVRVGRGEDIRRFGSGNIGATNVWRSFGRRYGMTIVALDTVKGFVPALLGSLMLGPLAGALAGAAAMLGHWRPLYLRFGRGGKMVATCGGALIGLAPLVAAVAIVTWLLFFVVTRYASVASIVAAAILPVSAVLFGQPLPIVVFVGAAALGVIFLHRANVRRLFAGSEHRFELRRKSRRGGRKRTSPAARPQARVR